MIDARFRLYAVLAPVFALAAVAIGAFGAHGLNEPAAKRLVETGAHYHLGHALAVFAALAFWRWGAARARLAIPLFLGGIWLFSGSLYALALGAPRWVGMITPMGGLLFMAGWAVLAAAALQLAPKERE